VIYNKEVLYAGGNRNKACDIAKGDILSFQDADDLPHPQRTELIGHVFENTNTEHLLYLLIRDSQFITTEKHLLLDQKNDILVRDVQDYDYISNFGPTVTHGNPSILRSMYEQVKFPNQKAPGEDQIFNKDIYRLYKHKSLLKIALINYREHFTISQY